MPDFGDRWTNPRPLMRGGQALTYLVDDADFLGLTCVAKILNNPKEDRRTRFVQEVEISAKFDHPNVVRVLARGETEGKRFPFFVMPHYKRGTLAENHESLGSPLARFRLFLQICEGLAYAHTKVHAHRDLKPANIFLSEDGTPVIGDFGLCYRHDVDAEDRVTMSQEVVGARKYMPPEWREGRVDRPQPNGDIYSLGKVLYWIFVGTEYDGHEEDHGAKEHRIVQRFWSPPEARTSPEIAKAYAEKSTLAFSLADELVDRTLRKSPSDRIDYVVKLADLVRRAIARIEGGGRVLNLDLPKPCSFCGAGTYRAANSMLLRSGTPFRFPTMEERQKSGSTSTIDQRLFEDIRLLADNQFGFGRSGLPLILVCDYCGNIQYFRLDLTNDGTGLNWRT